MRRLVARRLRTPAIMATVSRGGGTMKVNKLDHICIAVKDLEAAKKIWQPILGKD
jgi:hypothetical protein